MYMYMCLCVVCSEKKRLVDQADGAIAAVTRLLWGSKPESEPPPVVVGTEATGTHCARCFSEFFFLINRKYTCYACRFAVCRRCCSYNKQGEGHLCAVCSAEKYACLLACCPMFLLGWLVHV